MIRQQEPNRGPQPNHAAWSQGVLTLISIILGAALAFAAEITSRELGKGGLLVELHAAGLFLVITGTFYYFYTFTSYFYIQPNLLWVMLPSAVGVGVLMLCFSIGDPSRYFWSNSVFLCLAGACAYFVLHEMSMGRIGVFSTEPADIADAFDVLRIEMEKNFFSFILMLIFSLFALICINDVLPRSDLDEHIALTRLAESIALTVDFAIYGFMVWRTEFGFLVDIQKIMARPAKSAADC